MEAETGRMIPLPLASRRLSWTWAQAYNAVLSGKLAGELRGARWFIVEESVEQLLRERGQVAASGKSVPHAPRTRKSPTKTVANSRYPAGLAGDSGGDSDRNSDRTRATGHSGRD